MRGEKNSHWASSCVCEAGNARRGRTHTKLHEHGLRACMACTVAGIQEDGEIRRVT